MDSSAFTRLKRTQLPSSQRVHMGSTTEAVMSSPAPQQPGQSAAKIKELESAVAAGTEEKRKLVSELASLKKKLDAQTEAAVKEDASKLQLTLELDTVKKKLLDAEAAAKAASPQELPTKVWVTTVHERNTDNGNAVVSAALHFGDETKKFDGTLLIPLTELGKLRTRDRDANR